MFSSVDEDILREYKYLNLNFNKLKTENYNLTEKLKASNKIIAINKEQRRKYILNINILYSSYYNFYVCFK